jgi:hypothetical protein
MHEPNGSGSCITHFFKINLMMQEMAFAENLGSGAPRSEDF